MLIHILLLAEKMPVERQRLHLRLRQSSLIHAVEGAVLSSWVRVFFELATVNARVSLLIRTQIVLGGFPLRETHRSTITYTVTC